MEGLIPFVIDAFRKSHERSAYRSLSSDGSSRGGSRLHLIDYSELPDAAADEGHHRRARSDYVQATGARRGAEEYGRPAAVAAGPAYRRK